MSAIYGLTDRLSMVPTVNILKFNFFSDGIVETLEAVGLSPPVYAKFLQNLPFLLQILAFLCL